MPRAGVVDELSLLLVPAVDGIRGTPTVFEIDGDNSMGGRRLDLQSRGTLSGGVVWLRYRITASD